MNSVTNCPNTMRLFDFLKKYGKKDLAQLGLGYECEDGTFMSLADQAAIITHYLHLENTTCRNENVKRIAQILIPKWESFLRSRNIKIEG